MVDSLHELRTPLTVVQEFGALLAGSLSPGELSARQRDYLLRIQVAAADLLQRMEQFRGSLALRRPQGRETEEVQDPCEVLARLADRLGPTGLEVDVPARPLPVVAGGRRLEEALEALSRWACVRARTGGRPVLSWRHEAGTGHEVRLVFPAPTPSERDRLVLALGQVDDGMQRISVTKLFGVGIELARSTARVLGGELDLLERAEGGGCFRLRLPEAAAAARGAA